MKKLFLLLTLAVFALSGCTSLGGLDMSETAGPPGGPPVGPGTPLKVKTIQPVEFTVATLPSLGTSDSGTLALITDGDDATDCTTGGGTDRVMCRWSGSAWANAGDGQAAGSAEVQDEVFNDGNFNADTSHGVSQDDFYDLWHGVDADDDGSFADETWLTTYLTEAELTSTLGAAYDTEAELNALFTAKQDASTAATDSEVAALQADDLVTLSGVAIGSTSLGTFTGTTITDSQTIKDAMQELETAVESAGAADAFTVKVDAGATAGYLGAANSDGILRTDGTIVTYTDGGDYVTIGLHDYLDDIAGITAAQGDIIYFDGTDWTNLGPGLAGQYLKTGGAAADPSWDDPAGSGDVTAVGDSASGASFTVDGTGNVLYFEGTTANGFEIALTGANPGADVIVTIPATTGTLLLEAGTGASLTAVDAVTGDSATAFFDAGTIEHERGGLEADVSAYDGLVKITGGSTSAVTTTAFAESILDDADEATFKATVNLEIGTDVLAQQAIGITDNYLLEVDGSPNSGEAAVFTASGINGLSEAEFKTAFNIEAGVDFEAVDADIMRADTADTVTANWTHSGTLALNGEVTMGADFNLNANEIQSTGDVVVQLGDAAGANDFVIQDSSGAEVYTINSDGEIAALAKNDPYFYLNEDDGTDVYFVNNDDTVDKYEISTDSTGGSNVLWYIELNGANAGDVTVDGDVDLSAGHSFTVDGSAIGGAHQDTHIQGGADELDGDLIDIDYAETNYTPATTGVATDVNQLAAHLEGIDDALGAVGAGTLDGLTDTDITSISDAQLLLWNGSADWENKSMSGDATIANDGALTIGNDKITMAKLDEDGNFTDWTGNWTFATGAIDAGGAASVEIPNSANPTTDAAGEIAVDSDDDFIEFYGTASRVVGAVQCESFTIVEPDTIQGINDEVLLKQFVAEAYPHGVTLLSIHVGTDGTDFTDDTLNFEEWANEDDGSPSTVEAIDMTGVDNAEDDGTFSDAAIAADAYLAVDLDDTADDIPLIIITITYVINPGD